MGHCAVALAISSVKSPMFSERLYTCCCQFVKCANLTNLQRRGCEFVKWLGRMDLGAVRSSWDEYRDQRHRSKRTNSMRTRGELGKANADVSKSRKL
jgi:hypothetical protein